MDYLSSVLASMMSTIFFVALIAAVGYLVGGFSVKGLSLGTAGVLLMARVFGIIASTNPYITIGSKNIVLFLKKAVELDDGTVLSANSGSFSLISNIGTALFVTAVGLIAGPKFFRTFNKQNLGYILMGVVVIAIGALTAIVIIKVSPDPDVNSSLVTGLMTGALTSTPGLSAAKEVAMDEAKVTAGYGIAYIFGVLGVVFFVQLMPRILKIDIAKERESFFPLFLAITFGCIIGAIKIPGINFSLGTSGGTLIAGLIIGHFGHIGPIDCRVSKQSLVFFRELGLCLFLIGAGVPGGVNFVANVKVSYFIFGALITIIPMVIGYILGRYVFKLSIFNNLGSITGGMTSTPALGTLIATAGTDEVTAAYASTYPFALVCVVLAAKIICTIM